LYRVKISSDGNPIGKEEKYWSFPDFEYVQKDIVHLNSVHCFKDELFVTFLGRKDEDSAWSTAKEGGCYNVTKNEKLKAKLYHPHTIKYIDNRLFLCESNGPKLWYTAQGEDINSFNGKLELNGYLRGLDYGKEWFYLGRSERRKISRSRGTENADIEENVENFSATIYKIDRTLNKVDKEIDVSNFGAEIFDVVYISELEPIENSAAKIKIEVLETLLAKKMKECSKMHGELQNFQAEYQKYKQSGLSILAESYSEMPLITKLFLIAYGLLKKMYRLFGRKSSK
jgi:hypothetical protein